MPATACLNDIIAALDMQIDEASSLLDRDTGRVETVSDALLEAAEDGQEPDLLPCRTGIEDCQTNSFYQQVPAAPFQV
jgi:hypothetical protein